jgi:hypothetical protein
MQLFISKMKHQTTLPEAVKFAPDASLVEEYKLRHKALPIYVLSMHTPLYITVSSGK